MLSSEVCYQAIRSPDLTLQQVDCIALSNQLCTLTEEVLEQGASIGFLNTTSRREITSYWQHVIEQVSQSHKILLLAKLAEAIIGCVQLSMNHKHNGLHRAEVEKLLISPCFQRHGIATMLMQKLEDECRKRQVSLLVLDTQTGSSAEVFYNQIGYRLVGQIPDYSIDNSGCFHATSYFYKLLAPSQINKAPCGEARFTAE